MIRLTDSHKYRTSKDYEALYSLAQVTSVICFLSEGRNLRAVAASRFWDGGCVIGVRGLVYFDSKNKKDFIKKCQECDLEFLVPDQIDKPASLTFEELQTLAPALNLSWISVNVLKRDRMYLCQVLNGRIKHNEAMLDEIGDFFCHNSGSGGFYESGSLSDEDVEC